jgi:fructan beta-fructosidase
VPGSEIGFRIGQEKDSHQTTTPETVVGYNAASGNLYIDKTHSGNAKMNKDRLLLTTATGKTGNTIRLQILFDRSSLEVFADDGEKVLTTYIFPGGGANGLSVFARHGSAVIKSLKIWDLSAVNKN